MGKLTKAGFARSKSALGLKGKLTRKQVQRVFKHAIKKLGRKTSSSPKKKSKKSSSGKGGKKTMAKKKRRGSRKMTIPLGLVGGLGGAMAVPAATGAGGNSIIGAVMTGDPQWVLEAVAENFTGFNPYTGQWNLMNARGLWCVLAGLAAHKVASWTGVNRALGRAKIPLIRV